MVLMFFCPCSAKSEKLVFTLPKGAVILSVRLKIKARRALRSAMCGYPFRAWAMPLATANSMRFQYSSSSHLAVPITSAVGSAPGSQRLARATNWPRPFSLSPSAWSRAFLR